MNDRLTNNLGVRDNRLYVGGVSAVDLAAQYGTPLFVFDEARIKSNIDRIRKVEERISCALKLCYAAKANSLHSILRVVKSAGCDIEVNSGGELWKALKAGFTGSQIIFNGTSKEEWEIEMAIDAGIYAIQVDSLYELRSIVSTAERLKRPANVSLRLVPEIESNTHSGLQTALLTSKFGMMPDEALEAFREFKDSELLNLNGIHLHIGSQNPDAAGYAEASEILFHNLLRIFNETGVKLSHVNLGGGFPVNYVQQTARNVDIASEQYDIFSADYDPADAIENAWKIVERAAAASNAGHLLNGLTLLLEPGRSIIADAGICLTTVRNSKSRPVAGGTGVDRWLLTDAGFNILLSMETYKWYYHLVSAVRAGDDHDTKYKLAGPLCDGGDVYFDIEGMRRLPEHRLLPENTGPGDVLALLNCGAYSLSQASQYNGRFLPAVVLVGDDGRTSLIRSRDTFEDLVRNELVEGDVQ